MLISSLLFYCEFTKKHYKCSVPYAFIGFTHIQRIVVRNRQYLYCTNVLVHFCISLIGGRVDSYSQFFSTVDRLLYVQYVQYCTFHMHYIVCIRTSKITFYTVSFCLYLLEQLCKLRVLNCLIPLQIILSLRAETQRKFDLQQKLIAELEGRIGSDTADEATRLKRSKH